MLKVCCNAVARTGVLLLASLLVGCAAGNSAGNKVKLVMEPQYYGTWFEIGGLYWWDISATGANLYLVSEEEECQRMATTIIGKNRVNVIALPNGSISVRRSGEELLTTTLSGDTSRLQRAGRNSICRKPSGKYLPGAPFAAEAR